MTQQTLGVVGLGYVGLPLAVEFGKLFDTVGFDLSEAKVAAYRNHNDPTGEVSTEDLKAATKLICTNDVSMLAKADVIVIAVPTPVDDARLPDGAVERRIARQCRRFLGLQGKKRLPLRHRFPQAHARTGDVAADFGFHHVPFQEGGRGVQLQRLRHRPEAGAGEGDGGAGFHGGFFLPGWRIGFAAAS